MSETEGADRGNVCDEKTMSGLYQAYAQELFSFLFYRYGSTGETQDLVQEAFIKLWERCKQVSPDKARGFLYRVARNLSLNRIKHQKVILAYRDLHSGESSTPSPEFELEHKEYWAQYQTALAELPEDQRVAFLMNKAEGKTHKEIAESMGISRKSVEYKIYRAFSALRSRLNDFNVK